MTTTDTTTNPSLLDENVRGTVAITRAEVLVRKADSTRKQYPPSVTHDVYRAWEILDHGNDGGMYVWHIAYDGAPETADRLLDEVFYAFVEQCRLQFEIAAYANYIVDDEIVLSKPYGSDDGLANPLHFFVHCDTSEASAEELVNELVGRTSEHSLLIVFRPDDSELGYDATVYPHSEIDPVDPKRPDEDTIGGFNDEDAFPSGEDLHTKE